jgi:hypothetical protein
LAHFLALLAALMEVLQEEKASLLVRAFCVGFALV